MLGRLVTVGGSVRARQATLALEVARDAAGELLDQLRDVGIGERRGGLEAWREGAAWRDEGAVEDKRVEVQVEIERAPKPLCEDHGARAGGELGLTARGGLALARTRARKSLGGASECALLQPTEQRARDDAAHGGAQSRAGGEQEADAEGKREHPLAHGRVGQHVVNEVRGGVGHAPAAAGGAEAAAFAGKRYEFVAQAARAVHAREAVGEQAALEVAAQLALDETRQAVAGIGSTGALEEGLDVREQRGRILVRVSPTLDRSLLESPRGSRIRLENGTELFTPIEPARSPHPDFLEYHRTQLFVA